MTSWGYLVFYCLESMCTPSSHPPKDLRWKLCVCLHQILNQAVPKVRVQACNILLFCYAPDRTTKGNPLRNQSYEILCSPLLNIQSHCWKSLTDQITHSYLQLEFSDILAEPSSFRSFDRVWTWSDIVFESSRLWCYRIISLLCAVPVSLFSGFLFACLGCLHIW